MIENIQQMLKDHKKDIDRLDYCQRQTEIMVGQQQTKIGNIEDFIRTIKSLGNKLAWIGLSTLLFSLLNLILK